MIKEPTADDLAHFRRTAPGRIMHRLECRECGYQWRQPADKGRCPRCHGEAVQQTGDVVIETAPRA